MKNKVAYIVLGLSVLLLLLNIYNGIKSNDFNIWSILSNLLLITAMGIVIFQNKRNQP